MRDIRFRAWDPKEKIMESSVGFSDSDAGRLWVRERFMDDDGSHGGGSDWIPMQYTGLKDKNGKEIYEGDLVTDNQGSTYQVIWSEEQIGWRLLSNGEEYFWQLIYQIIGNIYENPELIKEVS